MNNKSLLLYYHVLDNIHVDSKNLYINKYLHTTSVLFDFDANKIPIRTYMYLLMEVGRKGT